MKKRGSKLILGKKGEGALDQLYDVLTQLIVIAIVAMVLFAVGVSISKSQVFTKMYLAADTALLIDTISAAPGNLRILYGEPFPHTLAPRMEPPYAVAYAEEDDAMFGFYPFMPTYGYTYRLGAYPASGILYTKEGTIISSAELEPSTIFELLEETGSFTKKTCESVQTYDEGWLSRKVIVFDAYFTDMTSPSLRQSASSLMESVSSQINIHRGTTVSAENDNIYYTMDVTGEPSKFAGKSIDSRIKEFRGAGDTPKTDILIVFRMLNQGSSFKVSAKPDSPESRKLGCILLNQYNNYQKAPYLLQDASVTDEIHPLLEAAKAAVTIDIPQSTEAGEAVNIQKLGYALYRGLDEYYRSSTDLQPVHEVKITSPVEGSSYITKAYIPLAYEAKDSGGATLPPAQLKASWLLDGKSFDPGTLYAMPPLEKGSHTLNLTVTGPDRAGSSAEITFEVAEGGFSILYVPLVVDDATTAKIDALHKPLLDAVKDSSCIKKNTLMKGCAAPIDYAKIEEKAYAEIVPPILLRDCLAPQNINTAAFDLIVFIDPTFPETAKRLFIRDSKNIVVTASATTDRLVADYLNIAPSKLAEADQLKCAT